MSRVSETKMAFLSKSYFLKEEKTSVFVTGNE